MNERLIGVVKKLIPEISELESHGYTLNGVMRGNLAFDIEMSKDGEPAITFAGYYRANAGQTTVKFERVVDGGQSEIAGFKISRLSRTHCLVEEVWEDEDENTRNTAYLATIDSEVQMPCPKKVVLENAHTTMVYKRYLKFGDKIILKGLLPQLNEENE